MALDQLGAVAVDVPCHVVASDPKHPVPARPCAVADHQDRLAEQGRHRVDHPDRVQPETGAHRRQARLPASSWCPDLELLSCAIMFVWVCISFCGRGVWRAHDDLSVFVHRDRVEPPLGKHGLPWEGLAAGSSPSREHPHQAAPSDSTAYRRRHRAVTCPVPSAGSSFRTRDVAVGQPCAKRPASGLRARPATWRRSSRRRAAGVLQGGGWLLGWRDGKEGPHRC